MAESFLSWVLAAMPSPPPVPSGAEDEAALADHPPPFSFFEIAQFCLICLLSLVAERYLPAKDDAEVVIGAWHRQRGWRQTLLELQTSVLCGWFAWTVLRGPAAELTEGCHVAHLLLAIVFALPKLPATEMVYDFLLHTGVWIGVVYGVAAVGWEQRLQSAAIALFPLKTIALGEITYQKRSTARALWHSFSAVLLLFVPARLVGYSTVLESLLSSAVAAAQLPYNVRYLLAVAATFPLCMLASILWGWLFHFITRRNIAAMDREDDEAIPGVNQPDMGTASRSKKGKGRKVK